MEKNMLKKNKRCEIFNFSKKIGIIGCGNLGKHLLECVSKNILKDNITVSVKSLENSKKLYYKYGIKVYRDNGKIGCSGNKNIAKSSDIIFLTVKPNEIFEICKNISPEINNQNIIVSAAAGIPISSLTKYLPNNIPIIRCMPNIAISEGKGVITYTGNQNVTYKHQKILEKVTEGPANIWFENEDKIDMSTAISGCGPAFIAEIMRNYIKAGENIGFSRRESEMLFNLTFQGTFELSKKYELSEIIENVASKGGATERGLEEFKKMGISDCIFKTLNQSYKRVLDINKEFN